MANEGARQWDKQERGQHKTGRQMPCRGSQWERPALHSSQDKAKGGGLAASRVRVAEKGALTA